MTRMSPLYEGQENHYKKMLELQEKLRQSEEERIRLEERFNLLLQQSRNRHETCINRLRIRYVEFLEDQRSRDERNNKLLGVLDKIDNSLALMTSKTDRLNILRKQYEAYLLRVYGNQRLVANVSTDSGLDSQRERLYSAPQTPTPSSLSRNYQLSLPRYQSPIPKITSSYSSETFSPKNRQKILLSHISSYLEPSPIRPINPQIENDVGLPLPRYLATSSPVQRIDDDLERYISKIKQLHKEFWSTQQQSRESPVPEEQSNAVQKALVVEKAPEQPQIFEKIERVEKVEKPKEGGPQTISSAATVAAVAVAAGAVVAEREEDQENSENQENPLSEGKTEELSSGGYVHNEGEGCIEDDYDESVDIDSWMPEEVERTDEELNKHLRQRPKQRLESIKEVELESNIEEEPQQPVEEEKEQTLYEYTKYETESSYVGYEQYQNYESSVDPEQPPETQQVEDQYQVVEGMQENYENYDTQYAYEYSQEQVESSQYYDYTAENHQEANYGDYGVDPNHQDVNYQDYETAENLQEVNYDEYAQPGTHQDGNYENYETTGNNHQEANYDDYAQPVDYEQQIQTDVINEQGDPSLRVDYYQEDISSADENAKKAKDGKVKSSDESENSAIERNLTNTESDYDFN